MNFKHLFSIKHLHLTDLDKIDTPIFTITNDAALKKEILGSHLLKIVGVKAVQSYGNNYIAYSTTHLDKLNDDTIRQANVDFIQKAEQLTSFLQFLWFVKDNSVSVDEAYGIIEEAEKWNYWTDHSFQSKCDGSFKNESFSKQEIGDATNLMFKYLEICPRRIVESKHHNNSASNLTPGYVYSAAENKIERAMVFLNTARSTPYLPQKIAHYMSILECLFSTDSSEVLQKVSERTAYYIGVSKENRIDIFRTVKSAYDVRSKFVHGQPMAKKHDLVELSTKIDAILRTIFKKIILNDNKVFLRDEKALNEYLTQMIF